MKTVLRRDGKAYFTHDESPQLASKNKLARALLNFGYKQMQMSQIASLVCATVIFFGLHDYQESNFTLNVWYSCFFLVVVLRLMLTQIYFYKKIPQNVKLWKALFILGALVGGISWGFVGGTLFPVANTAEQLFIIFIMAGVTAGGVPSLASEFKASLAFLIPALAPLIFHLLNNSDNRFFMLFGVSTSAYFVSLCLFSLNTHRIIKKSIQVQFENDSLLETLSRAKRQLEHANYKLEQAATHDPLTGVANRSLLETYFKKAIAEAKYNGSNVVLFYLDIDKFKETNDQYGHDTGDKLLLAILGRIKQILRRTDLVARLGGDEIIIVIPDITEINTVTRLASQICAAIHRPLKINNHLLHISISMGISISPTDGNDIDTLLKKADEAMYFIKQHGRNGFHFSTPPAQLEQLFTSP